MVQLPLQEGLDLLVEAFADALDLLHESGAEAELVLVGDGPQQAEARRIARERGICDHVKFLGMRDALPEVLAPADVFCLPSREESFGLSALEAMACGTAVLGTRVGGLPEVVEDGISGYLVALDDREGYARRLADLLGDRDRARKMGVAARERAATHFDRNHVVRSYEDLYRALIAEDAPCPGE